MFTNVNRGVPKYTEGCKIRLTDWFNHYGKLACAVTLIIGFFLFINVMLTCLLCCKDKREGAHGDYYTAMGNSYYHR